MSDRLPEIIEPLHLADTRGELKGKISLSSLDRLAKMLVNDSGTIDVDLFFGREGRLAKVEGHIETVLALQCQNCLEAVEWPIDCDIKLGIVTSIDQANRLSEEYEPLMVEEEKIPLKITLATVDQTQLVKAANLLKEQWKKVGVDLEIKTYDIATLERDVIRYRDYDAILFGEILGILPDPFPFWHSSQIE